MRSDGGCGGREHEMKLVIPFAFIHGVNIDDMGDRFIDYLYGDNSRNENTDSFVGRDKFALPQYQSIRRRREGRPVRKGVE